MKVESLNTSNSSLISKGPSPLTVGAGRTSQVPAKSLGETPPIILSLSEIGDLASLFAPNGRLERLRKRLNQLKNKKCRIVPAKGTTACVDDKDVVYLGVEFLQNNKDNLAALAGVMAHEWGHSCAMKPSREELQSMTWDEIFELRRAHETLADETSGRLLYLLGYKPEPLIEFLNKGKETHNLKYHNRDIRSAVILHGFQDEKRKADFSKNLFSKSTYPNRYSHFLIDIA